jgi:hypothetical protein
MGGLRRGSDFCSIRKLGRRVLGAALNTLDFIEGSLAWPFCEVLL